MGALEQPKYTSPEEYLLSENGRPDDGIKYEYINGQMYLMAGASRSHNRASGILFARLFNHLENSNCQVFQSGMKVEIQSGDDIYYFYPDIQVSCEEEGESYYNSSPCFIIEVLSDSTAKKDRTEKLLAYQQIESLQEYVLCSQDSPYIEVYRKRLNWKTEVYSSGQILLLESIELEVLIDDVYSYLR